jgi:type IV pilus assembly protein PilE
MKKNGTGRQRGFTVMELLIVLTILGILMGIAVPSYTEHVRKGKRAQAHARLSQLAQLMERSYSDNGTYNTTLPALLGLAAGTTIYSGSNNEAGSAYTITFVGTPDTATFMLLATPSNWTDAACGPLTLTNAGIKGTRSDGSTNDSPAKPGCW